MSYALAFKPSAEKELRKLSRDIIPRVVAAVQALGEQPRPPGCVKLSHSESWRIRIGDYRVIYDIDDRAQSVVVLHIGHRREVYR
jgi:mRNA interferase RelE/StbE